VTSDSSDLNGVIQRSLTDAVDLAVWLRDAERAYGVIAAISEHLSDVLQRGGRLLSCGNGGSMTDAMHFAQELSGRFRADRPALAAQAISDPSHLTCTANDYGFDQVFARGVEAWGKSGDALLVFSTSGNSPNVVAAVTAAHARGMSVVGLLGRDGGALKQACDHVIVVPGQSSDRIQEVHITIAHLLIEQIEIRLFGKS
jgi:D-sedoheptulose 7-phosphate isomerase